MRSVTLSATDVGYATIAELGPRLQRREVSPVDLTRACLERIAAVDTQINAFITVLAESALQAAEEAERDILHGAYRGPLHGIPIAHKDLYWTRGVRTTAGSKVLADFVPMEDAAVVARLKQAGTILLGKLNTHEFAAGGTTDNPHYGATHNPWDLRLIPGGSSGGSAAALAAGLCLGATGTDTAGSIRMPSHYCGTTGLKPTYGRVSTYGVVSLAWSLDHAGPMARSTEDVALLLNAMAGSDRRDSASVERPDEDFTADLQRGVRGLRLGVPRSYFNAPLQPAVEAAWRAAIDTLVGLGAVPVEVDFSQLDDAVDVGMAIVRPEMAVYHAAWYAEHPDDYSPELRERFAVAHRRTALEYITAQRARERIRGDLWQALARADVLIVPCVAAVATPIGAAEEALTALGAAMTRYTYPFNLSGFPSLALPCGFDGQGLPIGLQLAAGPWQERLLLQVGHAYQRATDWHRRRPPLAA